MGFASDHTLSSSELMDALDGLYAYDGGAVSSGIRDENLRRRCKAQLDGMSSQDVARLVRDMWFTEKAFKQGYGIVDAWDFLKWLNDDMDLDLHGY